LAKPNAYEIDAANRRYQRAVEWRDSSDADRLDTTGLIGALVDQHGLRFQTALKLAPRTVKARDE
jgi:hypothetical protein